MSIAKKQSKKSGVLAVFLFIVCVALCGGVYYLYVTYGVVSDQKEEGSTPKQLSIQKKDWKKIIFDDPVFKTLRSPLSEPLTTGEKSNHNPFLE